MSFGLSVPRHNVSALDLSVGAGDVVFLLGANGTGKSSLMQRFYNAHSANARRITAHRQLWFPSSTITLSPHQRQQTEVVTLNWDRRPEARWRDDYAATRAGIAVYDLVDAENVRARRITDAVDNNDFDLVAELRKKDAPIKVINELLRLSNMPLTLSIQQNADVVARKNAGTPYSIAELSDGERNAVLVAANVLTAKRGALVLIDEPDRHLHRSIISPLLTLLFAKRPDCAFVVSTYDVMLPFDNPIARTLLIRGFFYSASSAHTWDADILSAGSQIDDDLKRDILGARRKILFVEGAEQSLDRLLYSMVFPDVSVIAKGSIRDVERAVTSIRDAEQLHWLDAFGLIDNDRRSQVQVDQLKERGLHALSVFSVEGVYYHPEMQRRVSERHASTTGHDSEKCVSEAAAAALDAISHHIQRLSERVAEKQVREEFLSHIPRRDDISTASPVNVLIDVPKIIQEERARLKKALDSNDLTSIVSRYPVRETAALDAIARKLGFQGRAQYESAVRKLVFDDANALAFVRSLFGTLPRDIAAGGDAVGPTGTDTPPITAT